MPLTPSVPRKAGAATPQEPTPQGGGKAAAKRRQTPTTRAKDLLREAYAPGADQVDCSICLVPVVLREGGDEEVEQAAVTACGHVYHLSCWQQMVAFAGTRGIACPNCRDGLTLKHALPLSPPPRVPTPKAAATPRVAPTPKAKPHSGALPFQSGSPEGTIAALRDDLANSTPRSGGAPTRPARTPLAASNRGNAVATPRSRTPKSDAPVGRQLRPRAGSLPFQSGSPDESITALREEIARVTSSGASTARSRRRSSTSSSFSCDGPSSERRATRLSTRQAALAALSRRELQEMAKAAGVKANQTTAELITRISEGQMRV